MNVVSIISIVINIVCAIYNSCIGNSTLGLAELTVAICLLDVLVVNAIDEGLRREIEELRGERCKNRRKNKMVLSIINIGNTIFFDLSTSYPHFHILVFEIQFFNIIDKCLISKIDKCLLFILKIIDICLLNKSRYKTYS